MWLLTEKLMHCPPSPPTHEFHILNMIFLTNVHIILIIQTAFVRNSPDSLGKYFVFTRVMT